MYLIVSFVFKSGWIALLILTYFESSTYFCFFCFSFHSNSSILDFNIFNFILECTGTCKHVTSYVLDIVNKYPSIVNYSDICNLKLCIYILSSNSPLRISKLYSNNLVTVQTIHLIVWYQVRCKHVMCLAYKAGFDNSNNNILHLYCAPTIIMYSTAHYNSSQKTCIFLIT